MTGYFANPQYATEELAEQARQEQAEQDAAVAAARAERAAQHEQDLRSAYLRVPGATAEGWEAEKDAILRKDREAQALTREDAARKATSALYRNF